VPGLFLTFEGGEGSGKSTQIERLAARLRRRGLDPVVTREPGGTPVGEGARTLLLDQAHRPEPQTEVFLLEASRSELVARVIRPALAAGRVVVCDRYDDSTLAYQGGGRGLDHAVLLELNRFATGGLKPDLTFLFDLDPAVGLSRRAGAGDANRLDREPEDFHRRVHERYLELARQEPSRFVVLDAGAPPEALEARIAEAVESRLGGTPAPEPRPASPVL
jgi:dTMP kinase